MSEGTLYDRLGGAYAIAGAVDPLVDRLHKNTTLNKANRGVEDFHTDQYKPGYKFMVTAWSIEATGGALLHKSGDGRGSPFPGQTHPTTSVTGMPRAVKPFRTATLTWNSAT